MPKQGSCELKVKLELQYTIKDDIDNEPFAERSFSYETERNVGLTSVDAILLTAPRHGDELIPMAAFIPGWVKTEVLPKQLMDWERKTADDLTE